MTGFQKIDEKDLCLILRELVGRARPQNPNPVQ